MKFAYADPPYPGQAKRLYGDHPDYGGEVDHAELVERLVRDYPDGWALSTGAKCFGAQPGDTLDDIFPGSGAVGRAWAAYIAQPSLFQEAA